jgi:hypothetical protein
MHEHGANGHNDHSHEGHDHAAAGGIEWKTTWSRSTS